MVWAEEEYVEYLRGERARYAWVMRTYGGMNAEDAESAAVRWYPYEAADEPLRGLVFHDEAWHWAMLSLRGEQYWARHPELADRPAAYRELD